MPKYRVYALIHGETLPTGKIFNCEIKKMSFAEQSKRNFAPIESIFSENDVTDYHKTYVTSLRYVDPIRIKSEYVIIYDIEERKIDAALGGSIKEIERICRFLSFACLEDVKRSHGENYGTFEPYIYQVSKIYALDENNKEVEATYKVESGHIYLPDRPERTDWINPTINSFLEDAYHFHDEIFERALRYLYRSSIGSLVLDSHEKIALDHFKSIEIIVNALGTKSINGKDTNFYDRLNDVAKKLDINDKDVDNIKTFWEDRSTYGDIAHPSQFDEIERYPNQFPIPSGVHYSGGWLDSVAANLLVKYYKYIKNTYCIEVHILSGKSEIEKKEGQFHKVYTIGLWGSSHNNNWVFYSSEKDKNKLKNILKKAFAVELKVSEKLIVEVTVLSRGKDYYNGFLFQVRVSKDFN